MLHEFIAVNRDEIIRRSRTKVATRAVPPPTEAELDHRVPVFLIPERPSNAYANSTHRLVSTSFGVRRNESEFVTLQGLRLRNKRFPSDDNTKFAVNIVVCAMTA